IKREISTMKLIRHPNGIRLYEMKLQGEKLGRKGQLSVATEILEVASSLYMVEVRKSRGDTLEFHKFYKNLLKGLKDIIWKTGEEIKEDVPTS
ncbi:CBL-interacting serine/threonine-protein kinase 23-like protein, partial [Drosera capensis]